MYNLSKNGFNTLNRTYVIAEIGINHGGNLDIAKKLIESAAKTGVDAVKFQTYITEKRTPLDSPLFNIFKECELSFDSFNVLKKCAEDNNVDFFSTPFDKNSLNYLEGIGCDLYKIASFDVPNLHFLDKVASTGKPVILSVGMSNINEISKAYDLLSNRTKSIALLHCVSAYPTNEEDANLESLNLLKSKFDCIIGHSDHTNDIQVPLYAVSMGAQIIEKHYVIDENMDCIDLPVSITEKQMTTLDIG